MVHLITSVKIQSAANRVEDSFSPDSLYYLLSQADTFRWTRFCGYALLVSIAFAAMEHCQK